MAVCKLAVITYHNKKEIGGYSIGDLRDCIGRARANKEAGVTHLAYIDIDSLDKFIWWAKHKIKIMKKRHIDMMPCPPRIWS